MFPLLARCAAVYTIMELGAGYGTVAGRTIKFTRFYLLRTVTTIRCLAAVK